MKKIKDTPLETAKPRADNTFRQEVALTCACNRNITLTELGKTYPARNRQTLEVFLPHLNETFKKYQIISCMRKSHFLAQIGHETGQLSLLAETLKKGTLEKDVYDGYKGRGLIQITYKAGYVAYGKYVNKDFTGDKKVELEQVEWATDSAGWYWSERSTPSLNNYADKNDLIFLTQSINGAFNGYLDRLMLLGHAGDALKVEKCSSLSTCPNMQDFSFERSTANNFAAAAFAWGLWHDPQSEKHGTRKSWELSIRGYKRFLELKDDQKRGRFGFKTTASMISHAEKRITTLRESHE